MIKELIKQKIKYYFGCFNRHSIAERYLKGNGIEIGALNWPIKLPKSISLKYVDRFYNEQLLEQYPELKGKKLVEPNVITDGETLTCFENDSLDFVIANHFLEHCQNPILAIQNFLRVVRTDGILFITIPDKTNSFDRDRPITSIEHLLNDYQNGHEASKDEHFDEYTRLVEKIEGEENIKKHKEELIRKDYSIHFHVWTKFDMIKLFIYLKDKMDFNFNFEMIFDNNGEIIFILRKL